MTNSERDVLAAGIAKKHMRKNFWQRFWNVIFCLVFMLFNYLYFTRTLSFKTLMAYDITCLVYLLAGKVTRFTRAVSLENIISIDCDPYTYTKVFSLQKEKHKKNKDTTIRLANGLFYLGEYEQAYETLTSVDMKNCNTVMKFSYYTVLVKCCYCLEKPEGIKEAYSFFAEISKTKNNRARLKKLADSWLESMDAKQQLANKNYVEYEEWLKKATLAAKAPYEKVLRCCSWAKYNFELNRFESAKALCEEIIKNGNTLFCVKEARELLEKIALKEQNQINIPALGDADVTEVNTGK